MIARLAFAILCALGTPGVAQQSGSFRIATYNPELSRKGPGLLLRDILSGKDPQILAVSATLADLNADVLILTSFDFDYNLVALSALAETLQNKGVAYPYRFARRPNSGMPTGLDLNGDDRLGGPADAQGFGAFAGQGGLAVLSRFPFDEAAFRDFSEFRWQDLPGNLIEDSLGSAIRPIQRLSNTAHWDLPILLPDSRRLHLLIWHATPPVFDGPEDRNGRRNHDEAAFWLRLMDNALPMPPPNAPFVLLGDANLDPIDGEGRSQALQALLSDPRLQDPAPRGKHGRDEPAQKGDPTLDTARFEFGGLRVDYVLPSADLRILDAGVLWPADTDRKAETYARASRHYPVWVDIALP